MTRVSFKTNANDQATITAIAKRYRDICKANGLKVPVNVQGIAMDITACHANGCPLHLTRLLAFPNFDFTHDVSGIAAHINRDTGKLMDSFLPRCANTDA